MTWFWTETGDLLNAAHVLSLAIDGDELWAILPTLDCNGDNERWIVTSEDAGTRLGELAAMLGAESE